MYILPFTLPTLVGCCAVRRCSTLACGRPVGRPLTSGAGVGCTAHTLSTGTPANSCKGDNHWQEKKQD